jgi:hypothetical protein
MYCRTTGNSTEIIMGNGVVLVLQITQSDYSCILKNDWLFLQLNNQSKFILSCHVLAFV